VDTHTAIDGFKPAPKPLTPDDPTVPIIPGNPDDDPTPACDHTVPGQETTCTLNNTKAQNPERLSILFAHGLIMWIVWYFFGFIQIALNRWFKHLSDLNSYLHSFLGWFMISVTIYSIFALIIDQGSGHYSTHGIVSWPVFGASFIFTVSGPAVFIARKILKWDTATIVKMRFGHRMLALVTWIIG
jgi:hypothetical protein